MKPLTDSQGAIALARPRVLEYLTLTKPELTLLSMMTAVAGFLLGGGGENNAAEFLALVLGTGLVGGGAGALNQFIERSPDALMHRTAQRPLPAGRMSPGSALVFGVACSLAGLVLLGAYTNLLTGFLGGVTLATYLLLYTPLKRLTPLATIVGAVPGALPPVMGWTAVQGSLGGGAWLLFALLFCWQMPHFLSLAWMYRKDYERAGYRILTVLDHDGRRTARQILVFLSLLLPVSVGLTTASGLGFLYAAGAAITGLAFVTAGIRFAGSRTAVAARSLFLASLAYFPLLFLFMILDRIF